MKRLDVAVVDVRDLAVAEDRQDFVSDHRQVVSLRLLGLVWEVLDL